MALLRDFSTEAFDVNGVQIRAARGGAGPPVLLLHGHPQTHVMWHRVAPVLAESCTALAGCHIGRGCYIATGVIALQGAAIGDHVRVGVGAIVHAGAIVPSLGRVGLRHVAVSAADGFVSTAHVEYAREILGGARFFEHAFATTTDDQAALHDEVVTKLLAEVHGWNDKPVG